MKRQFQGHMGKSSERPRHCAHDGRDGLSREDRAWKSERRDGEELPGDAIT